MTKKVVIHHLVGHRFLGMNEQGDKVMIDGDQPATGPRPLELLLMALGSCTAYDVVVKEVVLDVALRLKRLLEKEGIEVRLTRDRAMRLSPDKREDLSRGPAPGSPGPTGTVAAGRRTTTSASWVKGGRWAGWR